jgi:hypothetical protein
MAEVADGKVGTPFLVRHRHAVAAGALAVLALLFALHAHHWHFPHRPLGAAGEWPLLAGALAAGATLALVLTALRPHLARARLAVGALAAIAAFVALRSADPFAGRRTWLYAPAACDFSVEFPRRPLIIVGELQLGGGQTKTVTRALEIDVGDAAAFSAECVAFDRALPEAAKRAALDAAEAQLKAAATRVKLRIERVARTDGGAVALSGINDAGRTETNDVIVKRGEARAILGPSSILVLWAWTTARAGVPNTADPPSFFASVTQRKSVAYGESR